MKTNRLLLSVSLSLCASLLTAASEIFPSGRLVLGANYWASHAATQMWSKWDADVVEKDLKTLADSGMTMLRVFANWAEFQPIVEVHVACRNPIQPRETRMFLSEELRPDTPAGEAGVDERMMVRFEQFCDIAAKFGLKLIVCPMTGQMTFRNYLPPAFEGKNVYTDPYCLKWEGRYMKYFVERLRHHPAIAAWQIGNEASIISPTEHHDMPEFWINYLHNIIRLADPTRPIVGQHNVDLKEDDPWNVMMRARSADYLTAHPYGMWGTPYIDDMLSIRCMYFAALQTRLVGDVGGVPAFIEEHGARRQEQCSQRHLADYMRGLLWNSWDMDCRGMLWWCAYDQTGMEIAPYDWREPCVELGIFTRSRKPYPALEALKKFAVFQKNLPFKALPKAKADMVVIVNDPDIAHSTHILAKQAGLNPEFQAPEQPIRDASCYFLPSAKGRAYLTLRNWRALKEKVAAGATLYLSWNDTFLDDMEAVAGIEVDFREASSDILECAFPGFSLTLGSSVKRRFRALTAETLATAKDGRGVFFRNRYGKGTVYTLAVPMEARLYKMAGKYASDAYRIYTLVRPVDRILKTGARDVIVTEHVFADDSCGVVVVNNSTVPYANRPILADGWKIVSFLTDDPARAKWADGKLELSGNSGALLMLEKSR